MDIPEGYATIGLDSFAYGSPYDDDDSTRVKDYDEAVNKTAPFILLLKTITHDNNGTNISNYLTQLCSSPYHALEGSRAVDGRGGKLQIASSALLVVAVSLLYNVVS